MLPLHRPIRHVGREVEEVVVCEMVQLGRFGRFGLGEGKARRVLVSWSSQISCCGIRYSRSNAKAALKYLEFIGIDSSDNLYFVLRFEEKFWSLVSPAELPTG